MEYPGEGFSRVKRKKRKADIVRSRWWVAVQCLAVCLAVAGFLWVALVWGWPYLALSLPAAASQDKQYQRDSILLGGAPAPVISLTVTDKNTEKKAQEGFAGHRIVVHVPSRKLDYYQGDTFVKTYPVAVGKPSTPTPTGSYVISRKEVNPWWYPPKNKNKVVPSGPDNPLGYRWMEFAPLYGIHGTNTPWEIGGAVSNGCIRMREADVEELYEQVPPGTLVQIVYDVVRLQQEKDGVVTVGLYSDIYGYGYGSTAVQLEKALAEAGYKGLVSEERISKLLKEARGRQVPLLQVSRLKVNGQWVQGKAVSIDNQVLIPLWPVATVLGAEVSWHSGSDQVQVGNASVPVLVKGDILYVTLGNLQQLFGGMWLWHPQENVRELVLPGWGKKK